MSNQKIFNYVNDNIGKSIITKLEQDASQRVYYRIIKDNNSYILMDSRSEKTEKFNNLLKIYKIIKNIKVSVPTIYKYDINERIMILEDFGNKRFDKIINNPEYTFKLLKIAVECLVVFKNSIKKKEIKLPIYNYDLFKSEISEFIDWYYPFVWGKKISDSYKNNFYEIWKNIYDKIELNYDSFVHTDFFCNNLFYLPSRYNQLQCGIIDYQDALWGDESLDIVSLFEDSRRYIDNSFKINLIDYFLKETNQEKYKNKFILKLNFIGAARQTRILGRWIKLLKLSGKSQYLSYINSTWFWLENNLNSHILLELKNFYNDLIPQKKRKYEN